MLEEKSVAKSVYDSVAMSEDKSVAKSVYKLVAKYVY